MLETVGGVLALVAFLLLSGLKVVKDYNRLVIFRQGKPVAFRGPGLHFVMPFSDQIRTVDTRARTGILQAIEAKTADGYTVRVAAFCIYQIADLMRAAAAAKLFEDLDDAARQALIEVIGRHALRQLDCQRALVNPKLKGELEMRTRKLGLSIKTFELKDVKVPTEVRKSITRSERERRTLPEVLHA